MPPHPANISRLPSKASTKAGGIFRLRFLPMTPGKKNSRNPPATVVTVVAVVVIVRFDDAEAGVAVSFWYAEAGKDKTKPLKDGVHPISGPIPAHVRLTVPVKLLIEWTVTAAERACPCLMVTAAGASIEKSAGGRTSTCCDGDVADV